MNIHQDELTPKFLKSLYQQNGLNIELISKLLLHEFCLLKELESHVKNTDLKINIGLHYLSLFLNYVNAELSSISRANIRATIDIEKRYNIKYFNCVILEAIKYLYGYNSGKKNSIWKTKITPISKIIDDKDFKKDFNVLDKKINELVNSNITDREKRDLCSHYDNEPLKVYNYLIGISEEDEYQRWIRFSPILNDLLLFVNKYTKKYKVLINSNSGIDTKYLISHCDLNFSTNDKNTLYYSIQESIKSYIRNLNQYVQHQSIPEKLQKLFKNDKSDSINTLVELEKIQLQITYIYIDLASALCRFLTSEYTLERQFALKQTNVIIYEGFNKLYSINEESYKSLWDKYVRPYTTNLSAPPITLEFEKLTHQLEIIKNEIKSRGNQRQMSVHFNQGIMKLYEMLHDLNPVVEISICKHIFKLLNDVTNFLNRCMEEIKEKEKIETEKVEKERVDKIDKFIDKLQKLPDDSFKEEMIKNFMKLKSDNFLEIFLKNESKD